MSRINLKLDFPIILSIDNRYSVFQQEKQYTIVKRSKIQEILKMDEFIIDAEGVKYKRLSIEPQENINIFGGFHILYGFGACYVKIVLQKIDKLSIEQLKAAGLDIIKSNQRYFSGTMLPINKWKKEFVDLTEKDDILRYMFYFTDTSRYYDPDFNDTDWKKREGFVIKK